MKKCVILILAVALNYHLVYSQLCGTTSPRNPNIYEDNANDRISGGGSSYGAEASYCINVYFHIIRHTSTARAFTEPNIDAIVRNLNRYFSPHNIVIRSAGDQHIYDDELVDISLSEREREDDHGTFSNEYNRNHVINYFIVRSIDGSTGPLGGFAVDIPSRALFIRSSEVLNTISPHELGHCLDLLHTHETSRGIEPISRSIRGRNDCKTTGDLLCDTEADPELDCISSRPNVNRFGCVYTGGGGYNPPTRNIMSYSCISCIDHFTRGQATRMKMALSSADELRGVTSNLCAKISSVSHVCANATTRVSIRNHGASTTTWTSSPNVDILWGSRTSAGISANNNEHSTGWVKATLSNGIELRESFEVGVPSATSLRISALSEPYLSRGFQQIYCFGCEGEVEWIVEGIAALLRNSQLNSYTNVLSISPRSSPSSGQGVSVGVRVRNRCGYSDWQTKHFIMSNSRNPQNFPTFN